MFSLFQHFENIEIEGLIQIGTGGTWTTWLVERLDKS